MSAQVAEVLEKALAAFGPNGEKWGQLGQLCMDGKECAITGCDVAAGDDYEALAGALDVLDRLSAPLTIDVWQDAPERTFPEVKTVFEQAIAEARA